MALSWVAEFLKDLAKGTLLTNIMLNIVFHIANWRLSADIADQGLQICQVREFSSLNSRPYLQPRLADTSPKLYGTLWET